MHEHSQAYGFEHEVPNIAITSTRVIVADDDALMRDVLSRQLGRAGYQVVEAPDGTSAFWMAQSPNEPSDLLVLDLNMPGFSGLDVIRKLRAQRNQTPILLISGERMTPELAHAVARYSVAFLRKPFSLAAFSDAALETLLAA